MFSNQQWWEGRIHKVFKNAGSEKIRCSISPKIAGLFVKLPSRSLFSNVYSLIVLTPTHIFPWFGVSLAGWEKSALTEAMMSVLSKLFVNLALPCTWIRNPVSISTGRNSNLPLPSSLTFCRTPDRTNSRSPLESLAVFCISPRSTTGRSGGAVCVLQRQALQDPRRGPRMAFYARTVEKRNGRDGDVVEEEKRGGEKKKSRSSSSGVVQYDSL